VKRRVVTRNEYREKMGLEKAKDSVMGKDRNIKEFSSTIAEVVGRLRMMISDLDNEEMSRELMLMRIRENADVALRFMESMHRAIESDVAD
jgi:hypothetical protein